MQDFDTAPDPTALLKDSLFAIQALREWVHAVPDNTPLPAMPGIDSDWLDVHESNLSRAIKAPAPTSCTWTQSSDESMQGPFFGTCGVAWTFSEGGPSENDMLFCPKCGGRLNVHGGVDHASTSGHELDAAAQSNHDSAPPVMPGKDEALESLVLELLGTLALHDMKEAKRLGQRARRALAERPAVDPCIHGSCNCCRTHPEDSPANLKWKLVPMEPTTEMLIAGRSAHFEAENLITSPEAWEVGGFANRSVRASHVFAAMLNAAPQPAQQQDPSDAQIALLDEIFSSQQEPVAQKYRLLILGEKIESGDTVMDDDSVTWNQLSGWEVGMYWGCHLMPMRRAIEAANGIKEQQ